jgi:Flp pilus assembly protein TadD
VTRLWVGAVMTTEMVRRTWWMRRDDCAADPSGARVSTLNLGAMLQKTAAATLRWIVNRLCDGAVEHVLVGMAGVAISNRTPAWTADWPSAGAAIQDLFDTAVRHHLAGRLADAELIYRQILAREPTHADTLHALGLMASGLGRKDMAIDLFRQAIDVRSDEPFYHNNLGVVLQELARFAEAEAQFRRALALSPDYLDAHNNLGNALWEQGRFTEAVAHYQRAIALRPDCAIAHANLGNALQTNGDIEPARREFERAIELEPKRGRHYRYLVNTKRIAAGDRVLRAMEALARDMSSLPDEDRKNLHFALGKAYADLAQPVRSFRHLLRGNALRRAEFTYDEPALLDFFRRIRASFTPELMKVRGDLGDPSQAPIFIVGMPRSGTTLVEQVLSSHPAVFGAGELSDVSLAAAKLSAPDAGATSFPEIVPRLSERELRQFGEQYLAGVMALAPAADRITDKMPENFRYLGLIHLALPNARIIHVRRDPVDTCLSCFSTLFEAGHHYTNDLAELGVFYRAYATLMEHWRRVLPAGVMVETRYEDVVADLEGEARRLLAFCGLPWDAACLSFHQTRRPVRTASMIQVRQPIYRASVGRSRPYRVLLRPLLDALESVP